MKPSSWDKQLGLASPLECAASQSGQTNNPSKECGGAGCKSPYPHLPEGRGEAFFLDILLHRMSVIAWLRKLSLMGSVFLPATRCNIILYAVDKQLNKDSRNQGTDKSYPQPEHIFP